MEHEVERKFFFNPGLWTVKAQKSVSLEQGYLSDTGIWEIRLRRSETDYRYTMKTGSGLERSEWEVKLSPADFQTLWTRTEGHRIMKTREKFPWKGFTVEVDRYGGSLEGLVVAEVEFPKRTKARSFPVPPAFGPELTYDPRFKNRALASNSAVVPSGFPGLGNSQWSYGVLPYRLTPKGIELVIVSTRRQRDRWIFPKGQPEPGISPDKVAIAEAKEEAGISGRITGHPMVLPYEREGQTMNLLLFPFLVTSVADKWLEAGQRERRVISIQDAGAYGELIRLGAQAIQETKGTFGP